MLPKKCLKGSRYIEVPKRPKNPVERKFKAKYGILVTKRTMLNIIKKFLNLFTAQKPCSIHGVKDLYIHGYDDEVDCLACMKKMINPTSLPKKECRYCGFDYQDPTYCSAFARTADKHEWAWCKECLALKGEIHKRRCSQRREGLVK